MKNQIIAVEIFSLLIVCIILYGNRFETRSRSKKRGVFSLMVLVFSVAMLADMLSWVMDGNVELEMLASILTFLSTVLSFAISAFFVYYMYLHVSEKGTISFGIFRGMIIFCIAAMVIVAIACMMGYIYEFHDGVYYDGEYYVIYLVANAVALIYGFIACCTCAKRLGLHDSIATFSFIFIPIISIAINMFIPEFSMNYPAITLSFFITYIMLQSEHENELVRQDVVKSHQVAHDEMTGLLNRRAYMKTIEELKNSSGNLGVVFCDVNGLKYTNDNFGHEAGDKLICDFAAVLQTNFRKDEVYRISGDEFVVLMPNVSPSVLDMRVINVQALQANFKNPVAAVGCDFGPAKEVEELIKSAEKNMYEDKKLFYARYPEFKR